MILILLLYTGVWRGGGGGGERLHSPCCALVMRWADEVTILVMLGLYTHPWSCVGLIRS